MNFPIQHTTKPSVGASALYIAGALVFALGLSACTDDTTVEIPPAPPVPPPTQGVECKTLDGGTMFVEAKTITIHNNSQNTLYPVLSTSKNAVNQWLQGCWRVTDAHPTDFVYKLYVNDGTGIPAGSSVTITLPLYSQIGENRYITWWNGGRVVLADRSDRLRGDADVDKPLTTPTNVTCTGQNTTCTLTTYSSDVQFPENIYAQLSEYTFGDSIVPGDPKDNLPRILKPENVGYNISYVDHVYLPVAIGPTANPYIGYSGSAQPLNEFANSLDAFMNTDIGKGWPVYNLFKLKLPGGYNIFAQRNGVLPADDDVPVKLPAPDGPPVLTVYECISGGCNEEQKKQRFGEAVQRMQNLWGSCADWGTENISAYVKDLPNAPYPIDCPPAMAQKMQAVKDFFEENHRLYVEMNKTACEKDAEGKPKTPPYIPDYTYWQAITHIYGWVPFNEGCGAGANALVLTKIDGWDHAAIQSMYIHDLQYNYLQPEVAANHNLLFNPYVKLIHKELRMNAYGFSVDDAVGFMSELGSGLIFAVGGTEGLENDKQFSYADGFSVAIGVPKSQEKAINKPLIKKYGVCVLHGATDPECLSIKEEVIMPTQSQISGFRVGTVAKYPIKVRFTDVNDNIYTFQVNEKFEQCPVGKDLKDCPPNKATIMDKALCEVTDSQGVKHPGSHDWCTNANPNQSRDEKAQQLVKNYISFPKPVGMPE